MSSPEYPILILLFCPALTGTAGATCAADRPLNTTFYGEFDDDYVFSMGNGDYN